MSKQHVDYTAVEMGRRVNLTARARSLRDANIKCCRLRHNSLGCRLVHCHIQRRRAGRNQCRTETKPVAEPAGPVRQEIRIIPSPSNHYKVSGFARRPDPKSHAHIVDTTAAIRSTNGLVAACITIVVPDVGDGHGVTVMIPRSGTVPR
ncbi:hypothetical protein EVAR_668_1 [Eumeta japonica]|uniref:Uncharacterized protein n=1 Tax=Eumeta variegata TaxID=151549 RepID=A0A4C1SBQ8_EUMVA|nr:hypothetical protein EVAR_668_1 [Eumeta japonica]